MTEHDLIAQMVERRPWLLQRRAAQRPPSGDWRAWVILAGRGFGKTRSGAEWVIDRVEQGYRRIAFVGPTAADTRDVMVEGESGILACAPADARPTYEPSKRRLTWPNGALATLYSAEEPDRLRGPQHDTAWCDEMASWAYPESWDQLMFGLRLGQDPRVIVTTTPRPTKELRALLRLDTTVVTKGATHENAANLAPAFLDRIVSRYEGTRLGRQELYADILDDAPGALWTGAMIEAANQPVKVPGFVRVVVAIDPAATNTEDSDETGIIVAGRGTDGRGYVLEDLSGRYRPEEWARIAVQAYERHQASAVVAEVNNGGDMVGAVIAAASQRVPYEAVRATRGKLTRAEPVAALYAPPCRVSHVGHMPELEDQLTHWEPDQASPDRLDALTWALTWLDVPHRLALDITDEHVLPTAWLPDGAAVPEPAYSSGVTDEHMLAHEWRPS